MKNQMNIDNALSPSGGIAIKPRKAYALTGLMFESLHKTQGDALG